MNDYKFNFEINDKNYELVVSLNVLKEVQQKYGTVQKWGDLIGSKDHETDIDALIFGYMCMLNEAVDIKNENLAENEKQPFYTEKQVGRIMTLLGLGKAQQIITNAITESSKSDTPKNV